MDDREQQIELLNWVANQPDVLPTAAPGYQMVDLAAFFDNPMNVMFGDAKGLLLCAYMGRDEIGGVYEIHYLFTADMRGPKALALCKSAFRALFTKADASVITGATPREYRSARAMNRALGGRPVGTVIDGKGRPCIKYVLERRTWAKSSAD